MSSLRRAEWTRPFWWLIAVPFAAIAWSIARLVEGTSRVTVHGGYAGPAIYVNWHRHLPFTMVMNGHAHWYMMMLGAPYMMTIGLFSRCLGLRIVYGASGAGGREALDALAALLAKGESVVLAVDGPAGPAFRVRPGCAELARMTGVPIIPVAYRSRRPITLTGRWDRLLLPTIFDEITLTYGNPIHVARESAVEPVLEQVSKALFETDPAGR